MWELIQQRVINIDEQSIEYDLADFLSTPAEAKNFASNFKAAFSALLPGYNL